MSDNFNTNRRSAAATSKSSRMTTSRPSRFDDPRIVRVSRALGGRKDRHNKVCTVRGLRDRRVGLSVPTAIQLYDLKERLGLNQPSKVVDWLLDAAKHEIDELPLLPFPQDTAALGANLLNFEELVSDFYLGISSKDDEVMISMKIVGMKRNIGLDLVFKNKGNFMIITWKITIITKLVYY